MTERRLRPTFLLKLVVLEVSVGIFALVFLAVSSTAATVLTIGLLIAFWFVGIEMGLLSHLMERALLRRAASRPPPRLSPWFVDIDAEHGKEMDRLRADTRENPSLQ